MNILAVITHPLVLVASVLVANVVIRRGGPAERPSLADIFDTALGLLVAPDWRPAQRAVPEPDFAPFRLDIPPVAIAKPAFDDVAVTPELAPAA